MRRATRKRAKQVGFPDAHGIDIDEVRLWLPGRAADWPKVRRVDDPRVCEQMHDWFYKCWNCENQLSTINPLEAHHICGGTKGRSDEYTNIAMLCRECHEKANSSELPMSRILWLKWKHDRQHTDWVRLCVLAGKYLEIEPTAPAICSGRQRPGTVLDPTGT